MKLVFRIILPLILISQSVIIPQTNDPQIIPTGYISDQTVTPNGIVFTDEHQSIMYVAVNGSTRQLFSSPGCGRYYSVNKGGDKIGFKYINPDNGLQTPSLYDIKNKSVLSLDEGTQNAGQVSFSDDGTIAYTFENKLVLLKDNIKRTIDLGTYSNRAPISPDGNFVVYKDTNDQLWLLDLRTQQKWVITDSKDGYANAIWSPDSKFIAFTNNGIKIYTCDLSENKTYYIGEGESPQWSNDSREITFFKKEIDFQKSSLINSDIYIAGSRGEFLNNLTNTPDVFEMDPKFSGESNTIIYNTYDKREIKSLNLNLSKTKIPSTGNILFKTDTPLQINYLLNKGNSPQADTSHLPDWVYISQVYDTRQDWNQGRECCGATSCMEIIASYGILAPSPIYTYGHTSYFGKYISDPYTFNGYTFNGYTVSGSTGWQSGGHGYLWNGGGSPYSNAISYFQRHGITTTGTDNVPWTNVSTEIGQGYPYMVCTTQLTAAHIVVIVGIWGTGHSVYCNDPYGNKNAGNYGYSRNGKNAIYDWSDANTGHEKITPVVWARTAHFTPTASPTIALFHPENNSDSIKTNDTISIIFSQRMDTASTKAAFTINPPIDGTLFWTEDNQILNFKPTVSFQKLIHYNVQLSTSARNMWNIPLTQSFSINFITQNRDRLNIEKSYPLNNQQDVSTTVQIRLQFDAQVLVPALIGNVMFYNQNNVLVNLSNLEVYGENGKGYINFEPEQKLSTNQEYHLILSPRIADTSGMTLRDTAKLFFTTEKESYLSGTVIDNFETTNSWKIQKLPDAGIDTVQTQILTDTDRKVNGNSSGRINYTFTGSNGYCQVYDSQTPVINISSGSEFGIWVFGDNNYNLLEYWFNVNSGLNKVFIDTINWTGWKLKRIPVSAISESGSIELNSVVVKQSTTGSLNGSVYLDDAQNNIIMSADDKKNDILPKNYSLSQNYPNPFNPSTSIQYEIPVTAKVTLKVYDLLGREIATLVDGIKAAGRYSVNFSKQLPSGIYYYTLQADNFSTAKKMIILK